MDDPTGGMWIYLIFFLIPLARILPRIIRKFKNKGTEQKPEQFEEKPMSRSEPPKQQREPFFEEELPKKDDGGLSKDDFGK